MPDSLSPPRVTASYLCAKKARGQKIAALTAYDCPTARLLDQAGIDIALVGDSVGTNVLGYRSEQQVTVEDIAHHTRAVRRGVERAFVLADLPFLSYHSVEAALRNAGRLIQEGGADGVKLEGGTPILAQIEAMVRAGIPVMGHLGFTPQSHARDLYAFTKRRGTVARVQGRDAAEAKILLAEARRLQEAGVFGLVLEMITEEAAQLVSKALEVPAIGIGAGRHCDGQVLIVHDLLGFSDVELRLAKVYAPLGEAAAQALKTYREEVEEGAFPGEENVFHMEPGELEHLATKS
jgi:3-methyl-2-oxobutanoate hydroxymethyltransferase